jgi:hypothetical protein
MLDRLLAGHRAGAAFGLCGALLLAVTLAGCVSKSKANARVRAAYVAGQQEAMRRMQAAQMQSQGPTVTVNGEVRNHLLPWTEGMTLTKALVAAEYSGATDPSQIIIVRSGIATRIDARQILSGVDFPLQPGDILQLIPQTAAPKQ